MKEDVRDHCTHYSNLYYQHKLLSPALEKIESFIILVGFDILYINLSLFQVEKPRDQKVADTANPHMQRYGMRMRCLDHVREKERDICTEL